MKVSLLRGFNPWVLFFIGMTLFHIWRGSLQDILIFGTVTLVILSQVFGFTSFGLNRQPKFAVIPITLVVVVSGVVMFFTERHGLWNWIVLLSLIPVGVVLIFYTDAKTQEVPTRQVLRSRWVWSVWAVGFGLIEVGAYIASKFHKDLETFPSVSSLLDPVLDGSVGRAAFIVFWLVTGVYLFGVRRR